MIELPYGNHCSAVSVSPKNCEKASANPTKEWFIFYRFYTPSNIKGKLVIIKTGLNLFKTLKDKRSVAKRLIAEVMDLLQNGYNPIIGDYIEHIENTFEISPQTNFCQACTMALERLKIEKSTRSDMTNILAHVQKSAKLLGYDRMKIEDIRKKHIKIILEKVGQLKGDKWTANNFNHYRKYLSIIFKELAELDAIEHNPVIDIAKQKTIRKIKKLLTQEERDKLKSFLHDHHYRFWIFVNIFYHSGGRRTELLKVQGKHVDLKNQQVLITVIKGESRREVLKVIKDVALLFWNIAMEGCGPDDFVFSKGLLPGPKMINPKQITRRWRTHVKGVKGVDGKLIGGLGITSNFYWLKDLHSDEVADKLSLEEAGGHNDHTSTKTTLIYTQNEPIRKGQRVKRLRNEL